MASHAVAAASALTVSLAGAAERQQIYRLRHDIYALELGQHRPNEAASLTDGLDDRNVYLVATMAGDIVGFISITPPGGTYSVDKYFAREAMAFAFDDRLYEVRLLTTIRPSRGGAVASLLIYAAFRWIECRGGTRIVAIGRRELMPMYRRIGLDPTGLTATAGAVDYELMAATVAACRQRMAAFDTIIARLERRTRWQLQFPFRRAPPCFHGGASVGVVGPKFANLNRGATIINADVLDAWFPPSPNVLSALTAHLPWLLRTSPPAACDDLVEAVAENRGLSIENIVVGAGSSDLIFRVLRLWLTRRSRVLILDPTYGEYPHVLERVIGCTVDRLGLRREQHYDVDLARLEEALARNYDLVILVNPNSPTGRQIPPRALQSALQRAPAQTRIWLDETYVDYAGPGQSLEAFACRSEGTVVCKSMSKVYALSGLRVAYLCGGRHHMEELRAITPPWAVGLPSQVAAVEALRDPGYYRARYAETAELRDDLAQQLRLLNLDVIPGSANFLLCHLPPSAADAAAVVRECQRRDLFIRDASAMGLDLGRHALRIAVKDRATNARTLSIIAEVLETFGKNTPHRAPSGSIAHCHALDRRMRPAPAP